MVKRRLSTNTRPCRMVVPRKTLVYPPFASAVNVHYVLTFVAVFPPTVDDAPTKAVDVEGISTISTKLRATMEHAVVAA